MTKVVNIKHEKCDFYCARGSVFGNPFEIGRDGTRQEVIEKYRRWFGFLVKSKFVQDQLRSMRGKKLGCFCKQPHVEVDCHVDVIAEYIDSLEE